jgi:hypothetical protein
MSWHAVSTIRAVVEVEGPGAAHYLAMEQGLHRLCRSQERDLRAAIDLLVQGEEPSKLVPGVERARRRNGLLGLRIDCRGRLSLPDRGLTIELLGQGSQTMAHLLTDLQEHWHDDGLSRERQPARTYAESGCGARDPRTGAVIPRFRDVQHGRLDRLLEAWRRYSAES